MKIQSKNDLQCLSLKMGKPNFKTIEMPWSIVNEMNVEKYNEKRIRKIEFLEH